MNCSIENIEDPRLQELIDKLGAAQGMFQYLEEQRAALKAAKSVANKGDKDPYQRLRDQKKGEKIALNKIYSKALTDNNPTLAHAAKILIDSVDAQLEILYAEPNVSLIVAMAEEDFRRAREILSNPKISEAELMFIRKRLEHWTSADLFSLVPPLSIKEEDARFKEISYIRTTANDILAIQWASAFHGIMKKLLENNLGRVLTDQEAKALYESFKDVGKPTALFRGANMYNHPLLQIADKILKEAAVKAEAETEAKIAAYEKAEQAAMKSTGMSISQIWNKYFLQRDSKGEWKNGALVSRLSITFFEKLREAKKNAGLFKEHKTAKEKIEAFQKMLEWNRKNLINFDVTLLAPELYEKVYGKPVKATKEQIEKHKAELKRHLGEANYEFYMTQMEKKLAKFEAEFDTFKEMNEELHAGNEAIIQSELDNFIAANSPFEYSNLFYKREVKTGHQKKFSGFRYVLNVPRRFDEKGNNLGYYDAAFDELSKNKDLLNLHTLIMNDLLEFKSYFPKHKTADLTHNYLPEMSATVLENAKNSSVTKALYDKWIESIAAEELMDTTLDLDANHRPEKSLPIYMMSNSMASLTAAEYDLIRNEAERLFSKKDQRREYIKKKREELIKEKLKRKERNVGRVMRAAAITSISYKHKAAVEDIVRVMDYTISKAKKRVGDNLVNEASNTEEVWRYMHDVFYGRPKDQVPVSNKKKLTSSEKKELKELEDYLFRAKKDLQDKKITESQYKEIELKVFNRVAEMGVSVKSFWSRALDNILKFLHLKGLGWNVPSATVNLGMGFIFNLTYASGEQEFNTASYMKAGKIMTHGLFGATRYTKLSRKINKLMTMYNVVGDVTERHNSALSQAMRRSKADIVFPYTITKKVEYFNQGTTFIAMMLSQKVTTVDGKQISLWEAYDENGNLTVKLKEDFNETGQDRTKFKLKVEQVKELVHGNYNPNSPVLIKKSTLGRALMMFRSWMPDGIGSRFEKEVENDLLLGRARKGRYRSLAYGTDKYGNKLSTGHMLLAQLMMFIPKYLGRPDLKLSEIDEANLKMNRTEMIIWLALVAMAMMLTSALEDEEDEDEKAMLYFLINVNHRLQDDIWFYFWPPTFQQIIRDPVPGVKLFKDTSELLDASVKWMAGQDIIESGEHAGKSRLKREILQFMPLTNMGSRMESYTSQVYRTTLIEDILKTLKESDYTDEYDIFDNAFDEDYDLQ